MIIVRFADPEAIVIEHLTQSWTGRSEPYAPASISTAFPDETLDETTTHIQVDLEPSDARGYPITERAQVRVVCHASPLRRSDVKALASDTQGLLLGHRGDHRLAGIFPGTGRSGVVEDPDTHNLMVWFTVRLALKAQPITPVTT